MSTSLSSPGEINYPIFVSYAREDAKVVLPIVERLRNDDLALWIDLEGLEGAAFWRKEIVQAIERSHVVLFFASRASCASENISKELALANEDRKAILPVFLEDTVLPSDLRYQLAGLQRIAWFQDRQLAYQQMVLALRRLLSIAAPQEQPSGPAIKGGLALDPSTRRLVLAGGATTAVLGGTLGLWQAFVALKQSTDPDKGRDVVPATTRSSTQRAGVPPVAALRAVVLGNQAYPMHMRLKNPVSDARAVANFLRRQSFNVTELVDLTRSQTKEQIAKYYADSFIRTRTLVVEASTPSTPALYFFFYSGHAISHNNELRIVPVDVDVTSPAKAAEYTIPVTDLLSTNFGVKPRNQIILYAAAPGQLSFDSGGSGDINSPFTESFIRHLQNPALDVSTLFTYVTRDVRQRTKDAQTPWVEGSLEAPLFLGDMSRTNLDGNTLISVIDACRNAPLTVSR